MTSLRSLYNAIAQSWKAGAPKVAAWMDRATTEIDKLRGDLDTFTGSVVASLSRIKSETAAISDRLAVVESAIGPKPPPAPPPPPPAGSAWPYKETIGVCDGSDPDATTFSQVRTLGDAFLRVDVYALDGYAAHFDAALAAGLQVLGTMYGTWEFADKRQDQVGNPAGYPVRGSAAWAGKVAAVYKGRIPVWEIMNEPDLNGWTPAAYAPAFCDAAAAIKAADPAAKVATAGFWKGDNQTPQQPPSAFARAIVAELNKRGKPELLDFFAQHLYDPVSWNSPNSTWHMTWPYGDRAPGDTVREVLDAGGFAHVPIIATEYGDGNANENAQSVEIQAKLDQIGGKLLAGVVYRMTRRGAFPEDALLNADGTRRKAWTTVQQKVAL